MRFLTGLLLAASVILASENKPAAIITALDHDVQVRHSLDTIATPAYTLEYLYENDTLMTNVKSWVTVIYQNGRVHRVDSNTTLVIRLDQDGVLSYTKGMEVLFSELCELGMPFNKAFIAEMVKQPDSLPEFVMYAPGNTALIDRKPRFVWSKFNNANWYKMDIKTGQEIISSIITTDTSFNFTEEQNGLDPGNYELTILAMRNNDILCERALSMVIFGDKAVAEFQKEFGAITDQHIDPFTFKLLKSLILRRYGLIHEAISVFHELIEIDPHVPDFYKALAELYYESGMPGTGRLYYRKHQHISNKD